MKMIKKQSDRKNAYNNSHTILITCEYEEDDDLLAQCWLDVPLLLPQTIVEVLLADEWHRVHLAILLTGAASNSNCTQLQSFCLFSTACIIAKLDFFTVCNHEDELQLLDLTDEPGVLFARISITLLLQSFETDFLRDSFGVRPASTFITEHSVSLLVSSANDIA